MLRIWLLFWTFLVPIYALEYYGLHLERYSYPFDVHYLNVPVQNQTLRMAYMDVRPAHPNGKTVLLLHGKNFTGAYWETTAKALSSEGYRVVIPDQIGFGKSSKPPHLQYSFAMFAQNTALLMDRLNIPHSYVLGHSMGGMIATRYALMFPQRVEKLILEDPIGLEDYQRFVSNPPFSYWYTQELSRSAEGIYRYQLESYYDGKWKSEYQPWVDILASFTQGEEYPLVAWNQALISEMIVSQPVCYEFDRLSMPVLLIIGQRDKTALAKDQATPEMRPKMGDYPKLGRTTAQKIPNSTLIELDGIGHLPHIEAFPAFIRALTSFLNGSSGH